MQTVEREISEDLIRRFGFCGSIVDERMYMRTIGKAGYIKLIWRITLQNAEGERILVLKLLQEEDDPLYAQQRTEKQSAFSEQMRTLGIRTPERHRSDGRYAIEYAYRGVPCHATMEDWCGDELKEITPDLARAIGRLMAKMHMLSLENRCEIGCGTLFGAAGENDVDAFDRFCEICADERLDQAVIGKIKDLRGRKLRRIRAMWPELPKSAVQGDLSINNLVADSQGLIVFDYNNAGDEVLVSDLVLEGLLTAYEMELPEAGAEFSREELFPAFVQGYLSIRALDDTEAEAAWEIYTLYHALWFTRIVYNEGSMQKLTERGDFDAANRLLKQMLSDLNEKDDGRFKGGRT